MWNAICGSLETHPTLQVLHLWARRRGAPFLTPAVLKSRVQALVDMMKVNISMHTLHLFERSYTEHELYRESVIPYLETNRLRPHVRAIQKTRPTAYRAKVLRRALFTFCMNSNAFWMLLSGNAEVAFPSRATTIVAAPNPPTAGTAVATSTANVADVAASVISALKIIATGSVPTATAAAAITSAATPYSASTSDPTGAANVTTSSADKKRKARS
jgi:hypothetical protein